MIPSPFELGDLEDNFMADFQQLCEKYGIHHYCVFYAEVEGKDKAHWYGAFDEPTDGLLECLEETVETLKEQFGL